MYTNVCVCVCVVVWLFTMHIVPLAIVGAFVLRVCPIVSCFNVIQLNSSSALFLQSVVDKFTYIHVL